MALYILMEKSSSYFFESRRKQEIAVIKSLNQKRIPTIVFENIEDIPEIFTDTNAVLLVTHGINERNKQCVKLCNERNIPVISLHDKNRLHYKYIYSSISDNDDITASMIYRYFKSNNKEKIAFFGFYAGSNFDISKVNAFYKVNPEFSDKDIYHIKSGFKECMDDFLKNRYDYDGIYFPNDLVAIAFLKYFKDTEPEYLENRFFLGVSDTVMARLYHTSLSSVTYTQEGVKAAVLQIYRSLTNNKNLFNCMSIDLSCNLIPRDSTKKQPLIDGDFGLTQIKRKEIMHFGEVVAYDHKSDPDFKEIFILESLFRNAKTMDLLIIYMFLKGYSNSVITHKLYLTPQALNSHKNNYFKMVDCKDKSEFIKLISKYVSLSHLEEYIQFISNDITDFSKY